MKMQRRTNPVYVELCQAEHIKHIKNHTQLSIAVRDLVFMGRL